jgi:hypothetical protein
MTGFDIRRSRNYTVLKKVRVLFEAVSAPVWWIPGAPISGIKRAVRDANHSPESSTDVENGVLFACTIPKCFVGTWIAYISVAGKCLWCDKRWIHVPQISVPQSFAIVDFIGGRRTRRPTRGPLSWNSPHAKENAHSSRGVLPRV